MPGADEEPVDLRTVLDRLRLQSVGARVEDTDLFAHLSAASDSPRAMEAMAPASCRTPDAVYS